MITEYPFMISWTEAVVHFYRLRSGRKQGEAERAYG
jgi:hypothetical protein